MTKYLPMLAAMAVTFSGWPVVTHAQNAVTAERRLPRETYAFLSIPSVSELKSRWAESSGGKLWSDPAFAEFGADFKDAITEQASDLLTQFEDDLGVSAVELLNVPSGEVSIAICLVPPNRIGLAVFMDFEDSAETVQKLIFRLEEEISKHDVTRSSEEVDDTEIITFAGDSNHGRLQQGRSVAWCIRDSTLVISSETELVKDILSRWDGSSDDSLAASEVYSYIVSRCSPDDRTPVLVWYLSPIELLTTMIQSGAAGQSPLSANMALIMPILGLDKFKALGGTVDVATERYEGVSRSFLYIDQPTSGILNMFQTETTEHVPPGWVRANATQYLTLKWQVEAAFDAVRQLADIQQPGLLDSLIDRMATNENGPQIHIKNDIVDQLTGRIHLYTDMRDPDEIGSDRILLAFECKDDAAIRSVLAKVAEMPGMPVETREFGENVVHEFTIPNPSGEAVPMGFGVGNGNLNIAYDITLLEQVLRSRSGAEALSDTDGYRQIASQFPNTSSMIAFQQQNEQLLEVLYDAFRKGDYDVFRNGDSNNLLSRLDLDQWLGRFDFSKLPPFEALKKYLPATGGWLEPDARGAYGVSFTLRSTTE